MRPECRGPCGKPCSGGTQHYAHPVELTGGEENQRQRRQKLLEADREGEGERGGLGVVHRVNDDIKLKQLMISLLYYIILLYYSLYSVI